MQAPPVNSNPPTNMPEFEQQSPKGFIRRFLPGVITIGAFVGLSVLGWYAYQEGRHPDGEAIPVIKADTAPFKTKPQDPGGIDIPNTDKTVYDKIAVDAATKTPQNITDNAASATAMPLPEEPVSRDALRKAAGKNTEVGTSVATPPAGDEVPSEIPTTVAAASVITPTPSAPVTADTTAIAEQKPVENANAKDIVSQKLLSRMHEKSAPTQTTPTPTATAEIKATDTKAAPETSDDSDGFKIQLGAFKSEADANATWASAVKKYGKLLKGLSPHIERADLAKGTFYRLHAGPLDSMDDAHSLCKKLIDTGQGCFVVKEK